ncbi:GPI transamidase component PIG-S [Tribolium castaneum]|uniref:GPI transamidase component PIG-S-like Protein n=1 Tax=Tribolium castaneum TaxID=7070 RepID=D6WMX0_TRICA|nr:PREDICTED: GPI transamidase component PIG-S [Tribolium castaneum]EFA04314.1 GPI transamidase component PIG-S-like Protein [Tribolium castaneum]|eukprot:XP_015835659.1 PREDICTED: GPI transamidase component PIG-S [Tribolium castaneum]
MEPDEKHKSQKPAPTDDPECIYRIYNVLSYFIVLVVIGIPVWWYTTRVYRASLPLDRMFDVTLANKTDKQFGIPLSLEYDVLITIVNPDPENLHVELAGEDLDANLQPFLSKISPIADFIVKSQWLYLTELGAIPRKIIDKYVLYEEQLPHVITPLEKKLWSHLSPRPCLNLVLYVSHCNVPLFIRNSRDEDTANAFFSPRWGGIYIINPDQNSCYVKNFKPDVQLITATFISQLGKMLKMGGTTERDVQDLMRRKAEDMVDSTRRTLKSLAQLLSEINSIVISDDVALKIQIAVDNADVAEDLLGKNDVENALNFAKVAFKNAEAAFSDPSLLALLYFPDDQKYAVYIPLFLPVMIPVLMSLITVKKWYKEKKLKTE